MKSSSYPMLSAAGAFFIALTGAVVAGEVSVYGQAQVEIASVTRSASSSQQSNQIYWDYNAHKRTSLNQQISVVDNASGRIGIKAQETFDDGLIALAKFEFQADSADGDTDSQLFCTEASCDRAQSKPAAIALTKRESMVGLRGSLGQLELGRLRTPYKYNGGVSYDPFVATVLEARGTAAMSGKSGANEAFGHDGFHSNMLGWRSPQWGPVSLEAIYGPETDDNSYSVAAKLSFPSFEFFIASNDQGHLGGELNGNPVEYSATKFGGQLRFLGGNHQLSLQYETINNKNNGNDEPTHLYISYAAKFSNTRLVAQYGLAQHQDSDLSDNKNDAYDEVYYMLGAVYAFSAHTSLLGGFARHSDDRKDDNFMSEENADLVFSVGIRKDFGG